MNQQEYNEATNKIKQLKTEIKSLEKEILLYENINLFPVFYLEIDVREFLAYELPPMGKFFKYNDEMYMVMQDIENNENLIDAILEADFNRLYHGSSIGVIGKVKNKS